MYEYEPYIVEKLAYDIILGIDFAKDCRMKMTCGEVTDIEFQEGRSDSITVNVMTKGRRS